MVKKNNSLKIKLLSTVSKHFYTTYKTKRVRDLNSVNKDIKIMKYDPIVRKHVKYV